MKLQKNKSYLLNFARRQGKSTTIINLAIKNAKANPGSTSFVLCLNNYNKDELLDDIKKNYTEQIQSTKVDRVVLTNGSKIILFVVENNTNTNRFRGYTINFIYIDNINYSCIYTKISEIIKDIAYCDYKLIITTSVHIDDLVKFRRLFLSKPYELIIKPCIPISEDFENQLKHQLSPEHLAEELTLGLNYGFFK